MSSTDAPTTEAACPFCRVLDAAIRPLAANPVAAACYRRAATAACAGDDDRRVLDLLARAHAADPAFAVAAVDVAVLGHGVVPEVVAPHSCWERRHVEIVRTAATGRRDRAEALLLEHVADAGCDPLAAWAVRGQSTRGTIRSAL